MIALSFRKTRMKNVNTTTCLVSALLFLAAAPVAFAAEEAKDPYEDNVFGNWNGARDTFAKHGVDVTFQYKADLWAITDGGIKRGNNYNDNLDIKFAIDGEKAFGVKGNKAFISFVNNLGGKPNANQVGSLQGIDNFETLTNTFKLYEAWVDQSFMDDKLSVLVGLHDLNTEFVVTDSSANFIKPVMQIGQDFAQAGLNGPSVFPNTSLSTRVKYSPSESQYVQAAVFDGVPGNPAHPHGTHIDLNSGDGLLLIAEAGWTPAVADADNSPNKLAVGAWTYTKSFPDQVTASNERNDGAYGLSSWQFYRDGKGDSSRTATGFFRVGFANGDINTVDWAYEAGIVGNGWVKARPDGEFGFGIGQAHVSNKFIQNNAGFDRNEYSFELYYRDTLGKGIAVQPDLQYIVNPGVNPAVDNATVVGLRVDINF